MVLQDICPPALIYLVFSTTQVVIDTVKGTYNVALVKLWVTIIFTILLNFLCNRGLGIVSWIIVFVPFILMTIIVALILVMFGLDPITGRRPRISHKRHHKHKPTHHKKPPKHHKSKHNHNKKGSHHLDNAQEINKDYGKSTISNAQRKVLNDDVQKRAHLTKDPLQKSH
jgi:predicted membrane protein